MPFEFDFQLDELCTIGVPVSAGESLFSRNQYLPEDLSKFCRKDSMLRRSQCLYCLCNGVAGINVHMKTIPFPQNSRKRANAKMHGTIKFTSTVTKKSCLLEDYCIFVKI
jgi:hypothetical protein